MLTGKKTEREEALERDKRALEESVARLQDENRTLKTPTPPKPTPAPAQKKGFLDGTFLNEL